MFYVTDNRGLTHECSTWDRVKDAIDIYVNPNELVSAYALLSAGAQMYAFSYGFSSVWVRTSDPRVAA